MKSSSTRSGVTSGAIETLPTVRGGEHAVALIFQDESQNFRDAELVIHNQDRGHAHLPCPGRDIARPDRCRSALPSETAQQCLSTLEPR